MHLFYAPSVNVPLPWVNEGLGVITENKTYSADVPVRKTENLLKRKVQKSICINGLQLL